MVGEGQGSQHAPLSPNLQLRPVREGEDERGECFGGEEVLQHGKHGDGDEDAGASRVRTDGVILPTDEVGCEGRMTGLGGLKGGKWATARF